MSRTTSSPVSATVAVSPYTKFPTLQALMEESAAPYDADLIDGVLSLVLVGLMGRRGPRP